LSGPDPGGSVAQSDSAPARCHSSCQRTDSVDENILDRKWILSSAHILPDEKMAISGYGDGIVDTEREYHGVAIAIVSALDNNLIVEQNGLRSRIE
jgi:hypothetical protein